jgi:uncharacterized glyoxalase superfamily protein PhnB
MASDPASNMGDYHSPLWLRNQPERRRRDVLRGYWGKLSVCGNTTMSMQKQTWGDEFGIVVDEFGITWLINISQPQA